MLLEDRELALIALVTGAFSRQYFAGDAVRPCLDDVLSVLASLVAASVAMLPLGVIAILVLGVEGVVVGLLRLG
jgi:hypothetical protein